MESNAKEGELAEWNPKDTIGQVEAEGLVEDKAPVIEKDMGSDGDAATKDISAPPSNP